MSIIDPHFQQLHEQRIRERISRLQGEIHHSINDEKRKEIQEVIHQLEQLLESWSQKQKEKKDLFEQNGQKILTVVNRAYESFQSHNMEIFYTLFSDNIRWEVHYTFPGTTKKNISGIYYGHEDLKRFFLTLFENFDFLRLDSALNSCNGMTNMVTIEGKYYWRIKSTGKTCSSKWIHAFTLKNDKITHFHEYSDRQL